MTKAYDSSNIIYYESENDSDDNNNLSNVTASLLKLVSFGDNYFKNQLLEENRDLKFTPLAKVRGCIADVNIQVALSDSKKLFIKGNADSRIAQGMLAMICKVIVCFMNNPKQKCDHSP